MIKFFAKHPTAANLVMLVFIAIGILSLPNIRRDTFPEFTPSEVQIQVIYPGATAEEVEEVVSQRIEDAIDGVSFVKEIRSEAREGMALIIAEKETAGDLRIFIDDIEKEVAAISDFPPEVEDPVITELGKTDLVISLIISGPMAITDLKAYCENLKDRMQEAGISLIDITGFSDRQLRVEVSDMALRRLNMSVSQLAGIISAQNTDLPAGSVEAKEREILLRFADQKRTIPELEKLVIKGGTKGAEILLGDVAVISDTFQLAEDKIVANGKRSAILNIKKTKREDTIRVADQVKAFIEDERQRYPQLNLTITQDNSTILADRLQMLFTNGWQGLALVFLTLWLFFNLKISTWVVLGLPVSFMGAFFFMPMMNQTINMMTMVGLLLSLGLLMDDAIVVGENVASHRKRGKGPLDSVIDGTKEVAAGVFSSFITTICVLVPLSFIDGQIGKALKVVPIILILVLAVSLVEVFCIMPAHLAHAMPGYQPNNPNRFRRKFDGFIEWVRENLLGRAVDFLLQWRYLFIGSVVALFIFSVGLIPAGKVKMVGFPSIEGDVITARLLLPQGTTLDKTEQRVEQILAGLEGMNSEFKSSQPNGQDLVLNSSVQFNQNVDAFENGPHVATVTVDLLSAEKRDGRIADYLAAWRQKTGPLPDVVSLTFGEVGWGPAGRPIEVRIRGNDLDQMKAAVTEMKTWFAQFEGVLDLSDDLRPGKPELKMRLRDGATSLGIDSATIARQLRAGFYGVTASTVQVGTESFEIDVRLQEADQNSLADLEKFNLVLADGRKIPLTTVVEWEEGRGRSRIARHNGMRVVTLRGDLDGRVANAKELITMMKKSYLPKFSQKYPELKVEVGGESKESGQTQVSMLRAILIGMVGIYLLLSFQFRSYTEPFIVMVAIPFSLIGVIWGHMLMGVPISMPSILGFIALSGIVVNDSILLVLFLKNAIKDGLPISLAAGKASRSRFRAVLLTSATTIAGLTPLMFETSLQAQILIPLVISTIFGLMASTVLVLLVIPCLYQVLGDFGLHEKIGSGEPENPSHGLIK